MSSLRQNIERFRRESEAFLQELSEEHYLTSAGLSKKSNLAAAYERHGSLVSEEIFEGIRRLLKSSTGEEKRKLELLLSFSAGLIVGNAAKEIIDRKNTFECNAKVRLPWPVTPTAGIRRQGKGTTSLSRGRRAESSIPYRLSAVLLQNEPGAERRKIIERARRKVHRDETPIVAELLKAIYGAFADLGFPGYIDAIQELERINLYELRDKMVEFLAESEGIYRRALSAAAEERLGIPLEKVGKQDTGYFFRAPDFDAMFPTEKLLPAAEQNLKDMGLDAVASRVGAASARGPSKCSGASTATERGWEGHRLAGGRILMDVERRSRKSPRAFCVPIKVPEKVILVTMPTGGQEDYRSFFHELGHALHFAHVSPETPFEYRRLGDNSVTESFAMLFEHLLLNPVWLAEHLPGGRQRGAERPVVPLRNYLRHAYLQLFYLVRRYAGKLIYELSLHRAGASRRREAPYRPDAQAPRQSPKQPAASERNGLGRHASHLYKKVLSEACLIEYPEDDYLVDLDMHFYCARYLRAWIFEANLSSFLERDFREDWFKKRKAGKFLLDLWKDGQKFNVEEMENRLGFNRLDTGPLIRRLSSLS